MYSTKHSPTVQWMLVCGQLYASLALYQGQENRYLKHMRPLIPITNMDALGNKKELFFPCQLLNIDLSVVHLVVLSLSYRFCKYRKSEILIFIFPCIMI